MYDVLVLYCDLSFAYHHIENETNPDFARLFLLTRLGDDGRVGNQLPATESARLQTLSEAFLRLGRFLPPRFQSMRLLVDFLPNFTQHSRLLRHFLRHCGSSSQLGPDHLHSLSSDRLHPDESTEWSSTLDALSRCR